MPKTVIKVYFNNGCTTLIYTDSTSAEVSTLGYGIFYSELIFY